MAGPLLVASMTTSPALVAGAAFAQQLPWPLFALPAGACMDRLDRRRLLVAVNLGPRRHPAPRRPASWRWR